MLVPNHRESDWIFSTESGHLQLLVSFPEFSRLILIGNLPIDPQPVLYNRPMPIDPVILSKLEECLTPLLFALSPKLAFSNGLPEMPFLGFEDDVIRSVVVERCDGPCVGEMLVENVELEGLVGEFEGTREFRRRLRFKRMPNLIQTQVRIYPNECSVVTDSPGYVGLDNVEFQLDMAKLVQPYFTPMVASLSLISSYLEQKILCGFRLKALCLGVGGGALLTFLNNHLGFEVTGVEADEVVLSVAKKHFGLQDSKFVHIRVGDGIDFIEKLASKASKSNSDSSGACNGDDARCSNNVDGLHAKFDVIMVDLDSSDAGMGIMAPPLEFVEKSVLLAAKIALSQQGILVINVIPPSESFYDSLMTELQVIFEELHEIDVGNGENFVLIATTSPIDTAFRDSENSYLKKLKLTISGAYMDSIRKV
ncbi:hypothetical protein NMG60_11020264 [Bertholletia excelsa]